MTDKARDLGANLRNVPTQARSRERLRRVLDAADEVLAREGAAAFTTTRVAQAAGVPVGSVYHYFPGKEAMVEALAVQYWSDFEDLVAAVAETDERDPLPDPAGAVLEALAAGFRARPGFLALWYGGLRSERVRDATRPTRSAIARLGAADPGRALATERPSRSAGVARMVVWPATGCCARRSAGTPDGDDGLLDESKAMLDAYVSAPPAPGARLMAAVARRLALLAGAYSPAASRRGAPARRPGNVWCSPGPPPPVPRTPPRRRRPVYEGTYDDPTGDHTASEVFEYSTAGRLLQTWAVRARPVSAPRIQVAANDAEAGCCCSTRPAGGSSAWTPTGAQTLYSRVPDLPRARR